MVCERHNVLVGDIMEIEIDYNGKKEIVVLKALDFGESLDVKKELGEVTVTKNGDSKFNMKNYSNYVIILMVKSIKTAPFEINAKTIRGLNSSVGNKISNAAQELNPLQ